MKHLCAKILIFLLLPLLYGCEVILDENEFKPQQGASRLVVDALITDVNTRHAVNLTKSTSYLNPEDVPVIDDALVVISDNTGFTDTLEHQDDRPGLYLSNQWAGVQGRTYHLHIEADGQTYTATENMLDLPYFEIDSLTYDYKYDRHNDIMTAEYSKNIHTHRDSLNQFGQQFFGTKVYIEPYDTLYEVKLYAREIPNMRNFYQLEFLRNGNRWQSQNVAWIQDDSFIKESLDGVTVEGNYIKDDTVTVVMLALTRTSFQYYQDLSAVLNSVGGIVDPPPGNPRNNISGKALGLFQVSPVTRKTIIVGDTAYREQ